MSDWYFLNRCQIGISLTGIIDESDVEMEDLTNAKNKTTKVTKDFPNNHPIIEKIVSFHSSYNNTFSNQGNKEKLN